MGGYDNKTSRDFTNKVKNRTFIFSKRKIGDLRRIFSKTDYPKTMVFYDFMKKVKNGKIKLEY